MRSIFDRSLLIAVGVMAVLLTAGAWWNHRNLARLNQQEELVNHTYEVQQVGTVFLRHMVDAETGYRGFLLTSNEMFLEPYDTATQQIPPRIIRLQTLTVDNPDQAQRVKNLDARSRQLLRQLEQGILQHRQGSNLPSSKDALLAIKNEMDVLRAEVMELQATESQLMAVRKATAENAYRFSVVSGIIALVLSLLSFLAVMFLVQKNIRAREQFAAQIHQERERLRVTLTSIGDGVISTDTEGCVTWLNPIAEELTAWSTADARGKHLTEIFNIINETTRQPAENPVFRTLRDGVIVGLANHTVLIARDGVERAIADSSAPIRDTHQQIIGTVLVFRDVSVDRKEELAREEQAQLTALRANVGTALASGDSMSEVLQTCCGGIVSHLNAAFARIWTLNESEQILELQASAGIYTHLNGPHARVPVGQFKIGRIAASQQRHLSNDVQHDPEVSDQAWARETGMTAFAGYPLLAEGRTVGVLALFARKELSEGVLEDLGPIADAIALWLDRRRIALAEQQAHEQFRALSNSIPQLAWMAGPEGEIDWYNQRWYDYTGTLPDAVPSHRGPDTAVHPEEIERVRAGLQRSFAAGESWEDTFRIRRADGEYRWHLSRMVPLRDEHGETVRWFGTNTDISEQLEASQALRRSEAFARGVIESSPDCVKVLDLDAKLLWMNENGKRIMEVCDFEQIRGQHWPTFWETGGAVAEAIQALENARSGGVGRFQGFCPTLAGTPRWWDVAVSPIFGPDDRPERLLSVSRDITAQRESEQLLRENEAHLRRVIDSMYAFVGILSTEGILLETNQAPLDIAGLRREQVIGKPIWETDWWSEDDFARERLSNAIARAASGQVVRYDETVRGKGTDRITVDLMLQPVYNDGDLLFIIQSGVDVTDRKRFENQLAASQDFLRSALDALDSHLAVLDEHGVILAVNEAWKQFAVENGMTDPHYGVGTNYLDQCRNIDEVSDADLSRIVDCILDVISGKTDSCDIEYPCHSAVSERWFQMRVNRFRGSEPAKVVVAHQNITSRVQSERATLKRSEQLATLANIATQLNAAHDASSILGIITAGARLIIGAHQAAAHRILDQNWAQAINAGSFSEKYGEWRGYAGRLVSDKMCRLICDANASLRLTDEELVAHPAWKDEGSDDESRPTVRGWLAAPLTTFDSRNLGLIEVSDRHSGDFSLDDELTLVQLAQMGSVALENVRLYDDLREADRRKDQFLATLAHELRNPLSPLTAASHLLQSDPGNPDQVTELTDVIYRQCEQLKRLIDDLLDVSRISTGKLHLRYEHVQLQTAISAALDISRPVMTTAGHTLRVSLPDEPLTVNGDQVRLSQVIANLLINAAKYTPEGGSVELTLQKQNDSAVISVRDTGIGVPPEMLERIFELFSQVDSSHTRSQGGLGIGLTLVKTLVSMHGGTVQAASAGPGLGSTFTVTLPLAQTTNQAEVSTTPVAETESPSYRIIVVDDNHTASYLLSRLLTKLGQQVQVADTAQQAFELISQFSPDIFISDIAMPGMSGYELARRIREEHLEHRPFLVALTGYGQASDRAEALQAGFDEHLVKPIGLPVLQQLLRSYTERTGGAG
ncbi:PAS domain-containing protein [Planctomicrobium piriforme]|uniref:histidine kinase n=1 Tax=Planctomicrobium piriforme TaxID=1576369 RepID=A0A1I3E6K4_9PLAN|nr:PAS domain-containing protein [Planctomicrobium piriforme]SFH94499.1 PAS domain S-box-containing protein [Planctomicrobium piriforme]